MIRLEKSLLSRSLYPEFLREKYLRILSDISLRIGTVTDFLTSHPIKEFIVRYSWDAARHLRVDRLFLAEKNARAMDVWVVCVKTRRPRTRPCQRGGAPGR